MNLSNWNDSCIEVDKNEDHPEFFPEGLCCFRIVWYLFIICQMNRVRTMMKRAELL